MGSTKPPKHARSEYRIKENFRRAKFAERMRRDDVRRLEEQLGLRPKPPVPAKQLPLPYTRTFYGPKDKPDPRARRMRPEDYDPSKTVDGTIKARRNPAKAAADFAKRAFKPSTVFGFNPWSIVKDGLGLFDPWAEIFEFFTPTATADPNPMPLRPLSPNGEMWIKTHGDFSCSAGTYPVNGNNIYASQTNYHNCLTGQSIATLGLALNVVPSTSATVQGWWRKNTSPTNVRYANYARFVKTSDRLADLGRLPVPLGWMPNNPFRPPNPNAERVLKPKGKADPVPPPARSPFAPEKPIRQFDISPTGKPMPWAPPAPPHRRAPPRQREKHTKGSSPTPQLGGQLAGALDKISEGCDMIDALYQALPPEVDKKWQCSRVAGGFGGQYEVGGCNCKAAALWHNFHKLDLDAAVKNLLANELEDRLIGAGMGARDKLRPRKWKKYGPKRKSK